MDLNVLRKAARDRVKAELVKTEFGIYREEVAGEIKFSSSGIKECNNQPFVLYRQKIELIIHGLEAALIVAKHIGFTNYQTHPKEHVIGYHYFETEIGGATAYFNVQLTVQHKLFLYSITETINFDSIQKNT